MGFKRMLDIKMQLELLFDIPFVVGIIVPLGVAAPTDVRQSRVGRVPVVVGQLPIELDCGKHGAHRGASWNRGGSGGCVCSRLCRETWDLAVGVDVDATPATVTHVDCCRTMLFNY